ncbi:hypothetical protein TCA2_3243 [Paenibacillus sp. TCA20]|nr:hypothetical protein TCA2_3243 [Paenibacillus sp. TCA20]
MNTMHSNIGSIKRNLNEALQAQFPPDSSIEALRTNAKAKKKAEAIPKNMGFI